MAGADINVGTDSRASTALAAAAEEGNEDIVKLLLEKGANVRIGAPLPLAAGEGHKNVVRLLLAAGAKVNAKMKRPPDTALMRAARHGHEDIVELLIASGADVNLKEKLSLCGTALGDAVQFGHTSVVKLFA